MAKGKTTLNLDRKDVPLEITAIFLAKHNLYQHVMVTVHNADQALFYYKHHHNIMMSAFVKTPEELTSYENAGVPWKNMIAYIGSVHQTKNKIMLDLLHAKKVMGMVSAAPIYDKLPDALKRAETYQSIFASGVDILESDLPIEVANAINH